MKIHQIDTLDEHPIIPKTVHYCPCQYVIVKEKPSRVFAFTLVLAIAYMSLVTGIIIGRFFLGGLLK